MSDNEGHVAACRCHCKHRTYCSAQHWAHVTSFYNTGIFAIRL